MRSFKITKHQRVGKGGGEGRGAQDVKRSESLLFLPFTFGIKLRFLRFGFMVGN